MTKIADTDLLINEDGSIYHLKLRPEQIADTIILVGDPGRVYTISDKFDRTEWQVSNREFLTHTGYYRGKRVTVLSTGIGTDNIDIVMNELDALVNVDFVTREAKDEKKSLSIIRFGTTGAIQDDIDVGIGTVSAYGLGLDGLLYYYRDCDMVTEKAMLAAFLEQLQWPSSFPRPYFVSASPKLLRLFSDDLKVGIAATAPGFYGPQGRLLRLELTESQIIEKIASFRCQDWKVTNFEMETSALYGLGKLLVHHTVTICAVIANRPRHEYLSNYHPVIHRIAEYILNRITADTADVP